MIIKTIIHAGDRPLSGCNTEQKRLRTRASLFLTGVVMFLLLLSGCKDNPGNSDPGDGGAETEELNTDASVLDQGEVGLVIDTRAIARKGYTPVEAEVTLPGEFSTWSQTLDIDPLTNMATLTIPADTLTEGQLSQLNEGVDAAIRIFDESSESLAEYNENIPLNASNEPLTIDPELDPQYPALDFIENTPYMLAVEVEGSNSYGLVTLKGENSRVITDEQIDTNDNGILENVVINWTDYYFHLKEFGDAAPEKQQFYLEHVRDNIFRLKTDFISDTGTHAYLVTDGETVRANYRVGDKTTTSPDKPDLGSVYNLVTEDELSSDSFEFELSWDEHGSIHLRSLKTGDWLGMEGGTLQTSNTSMASSQGFRLIPAEIEWEVKNRGTVFNEPIVPPVQLSYAFNQRVINCSDVTVSQTVGVEETRTTTYSTSTSESLALYQSHTARVDVTVSTSFDIGFVSTDVSVSTGYEYATSETQTTTNTIEESNQETKSVSSTRTVELPPYSAVKVSDAIRTVENVQLPFVQKLRVKGSFNGKKLTGPQIASSVLGQFGGVIMDVGADYVDLSVRGTSTIDNLFEAESTTENIEGACE